MAITECGEDKHGKIRNCTIALITSLTRRHLSFSSSDPIFVGLPWNVIIKLQGVLSTYTKFCSTLALARSYGINRIFTLYTRWKNNMKHDDEHRRMNFIIYFD